MNEPNGLAQLTRSKKFWTGTTGMIVMIVAALSDIPQEQLQTMAASVTAIIMTMIAGQAHQDHAIAKNGGANSEVPAQD